MPIRPIRPTTTSYSVLGLLHLGNWSAYELAGLMARSVGLILPRAASVIYEEPKRLVARGLAEATVEHRGQRNVAVYSITPAGTEALRAWLEEPSDFPQLDAEAIVKTVFATGGTLASLQATIRQLRVDAEARLDAILDQNDRYFDDDAGPFPDRLALIALAGRFPYLYLRFLVDWATWAESELASWPAHRDGRIDLERLKPWALDVLGEIREEGRAWRGPSSKKPRNH